MRVTVVTLCLLIITAITLIGAPEDPGFGFYIAPMITSGHFGVTANHVPMEISETPSGTSISLSPYSQEMIRRPSFGGKLGIFHRPDIYDRRHRIDFELQADYFKGVFPFNRKTTDAFGVTTNTIDQWDLTGTGLVGRIRWSVELEDRWQPYIHVGYGVNFINLEEQPAIGFGPNLGAGMRIRLCSKFAFYFEYETSPMNNVSFDDIAEVYPELQGLINSGVSVESGYSQVSVAFEFPIVFCISCQDNGYRR